MAATVMTDEFDTIHHYSSQEENFWSLSEHYVRKWWHFGIKWPCFKQQHENKLVSSHPY